MQPKLSLVLRRATLPDHMPSASLDVGVGRATRRAVADTHRRLGLDVFRRQQRPRRQWLSLIKRLHAEHVELGGKLPEPEISASMNGKGLAALARALGRENQNLREGAR